MARAALLLFFLFFLARLPLEAQTLKEFGASIAKQGPCEVASADFPDLKDPARANREVPIKVYYPKDAKGKRPLIVFSHGLGGSRDGYSYLGTFWASHGFVCAHVQHKGSDGELLENGMLAGMFEMRKAMRSADNIENRPKDIGFAIGELIELGNSDSKLKGLIDESEIGVAGHSFGAYTTLAVAGQLVGGTQSFRDGRVKAAIEMSAHGKPARDAAPSQVYGQISIPMMHMTGTNDNMPSGGKPEDRLLPYKSIKAPSQYLIVFDGGEHMLFSGRTRMNREETPVEHIRHALIQKATTAFWMAFLKKDKVALEYLNSRDGLMNDLSANASFERK